MNYYLLFLAMIPLLNGYTQSVGELSASPSEEFQRVTSKSNSDSIPVESPAGLKIGEYFGSDENEYLFCDDGIVVSYSPVDTFMGSWIMTGDTITISYFLWFGRNGIGEPLPPPPGIPGNYIDQYRSYEYFTEIVDKQETLLWSEIRNSLVENPEYPYKILERNASCARLRK